MSKQHHNQAILCLGLALALGAGTTDAAAKNAEEGPVEYAIIVTGGELLRGVYPDGHTYFITRTLAPLGGRCVGSTSIDDNREDLLRALEFMRDRAPIVIVTGGLGPTPNDITREVLAEFTGTTLREEADLIADLERRFRTSADSLRANLRRQTRVPEDGGYFVNSHGTAAGLVFKTRKGVIIALPGPPRELQPMVRGPVLTFLREKYGIRSPGASLTLRFVGIGQSQIDQTIKDHVPLSDDIVITSLFEGMRVDFTFSVARNTPEDRTRLEKAASALREHLGEFIYADDGSTLEDVVARQLKALGSRLLVAETVTSGRLAACLTPVEGMDYVLTGAFVAPTAQSLADLINPDWQTGTSESSATTEGILRLIETRSEIGTVIVASEAPRRSEDLRTVRIAIRLPDGEVRTREFRWSGSGAVNQDRLLTRVLDTIRRQLSRK